MRAALFTLFSPLWAACVVLLFAWVSVMDLIEFVSDPAFNPFRRRKSA